MQESAEATDQERVPDTTTDQERVPDTTTDQERVPDTKKEQERTEAMSAYVLLALRSLENTFNVRFKVEGEDIDFRLVHDSIKRIHSGDVQDSSKRVHKGDVQ